MGQKYKLATLWPTTAIARCHHVVLTGEGNRMGIYGDNDRFVRQSLRVLKTQSIHGIAMASYAEATIVVAFGGCEARILLLGKSEGQVRDFE